ncbi:MAG: hypothetical protein J2P46_03770 [Zavarzinella sp.]|nr:hypothetical protein [Zavarzinella sp.]
MSTRTRRSLAAILALTLLGSAGDGTAPVRGQIPDIREPSPLFTGKAIPEPPRQQAKWDPPTSTVPKEFVGAATLLFEQGLADPRGCEYRVVSVTTGSCWTGDGGVVRTRGWVLPAGSGDTHRFAVCWNGLVYPLASAGDKADLRRDVKTAVESRAKDRDRDEGVGRRLSEEGWSLGHGNLGNIAVALLLRLGEGDLASELWGPAHPGEKGEDYYVGLAASWAWTQFDRALGAHMRGDDALALYGFRRLATFAEGVRAVAKKRGVNLDAGGGDALGFLGQLPELLADQERRAKGGPRGAVVCIGPGRDPDQKKRVAALIDRLDEVDARQSGQPGGVDLGEDPVVQALIREGEPALESLLRCFEGDRRMTRSVHFWRDFSRSRTCLSVHEAAFVALGGILARSDFAPASTGDNLTARGERTRKELAELIREQVKTAKRLPPARRWLAVLADDRAKPEEWVAAAERLASPDDVAVAPGTMVWSGSAVRLRPREGKPKLVGEPLRDQKGPSVTDLLLKRMGQCEPRLSAELALTLAAWEPGAALKPLAEQMKRLREKESYYGYVRLVECRCELGDMKAMDDYADFIGSATTETLDKAYEERGFPNLFHPMADYPNHPGVVAAAEKLFGDPKSPWLPLVRSRGAQTDRVHELIPTNLLRLPAFRAAVIKELGNKGGNGTIRVDKYGSMAMDLPGVTNSYGGGSGSRELDIPEGGAGDRFRVCDFVAWKIADEIEGAPRCELYWPEDRRDKAVAECAGFLRQYGGHLFRDQKALVGDRPAAPQDVREGKAVFSLEGEGETRVVAGLKLPREARWMTLKHRPYQETVTDPESGKKTVTTRYHQDGRVVQAEEVKKDGRWQRYYGFVGCNQVARVPADDVEFPPEGSRPWDRVRDWVAVGPGFHVRLNVPPLTVEPFENLPPRLPADANLAFSLTARNSRGLALASPEPGRSVRLRLLYSPEVVAPKGWLAPKAAREAEWVEIPAKAGSVWKAEKGKMLAPTEEMTLATVDLREWFDVGRSGFYRLQLFPVPDRPGSPAESPAEVRFSLAPRPKPGAK